jgi:hypothetical protein
MGFATRFCAALRRGFAHVIFVLCRVHNDECIAVNAQNATSN